MTSEMIIAALRSGADHLDSKPSVTNTFYGSLMRDSADRISDVEKMYRTQTARIAELQRENAALRELSAQMAKEMRETDPEFASLKDYDAARKGAQPCPHCTNGIVRSLGRDNDEVIEDCPHCSREQRKEAQP